MSGDRDRGAALIVAIAFVLMIGAITAGLSALVTSGLNDQIVLGAARDREYAVDGALEDAIAEVRARIDDGSATCSTGSGSSTSSLNGTSVRVEWAPSCTTAIGLEGLAVVQRGMVFAACADTGSPCTADGLLLTAEVEFQQGVAGDVSRTFVQSWSAAP